jgi:hypothetical protein
MQARERGREQGQGHVYSHSSNTGLNSSASEHGFGYGHNYGSRGYAHESQPGGAEVAEEACAVAEHSLGGVSLTAHN